MAAFHQVACRISLEMLQFFPHSIVVLLDDLKVLEQEAATWGFARRLSAERRSHMQALLGAVADSCQGLSLASSTKQIIEIGRRLGHGLASRDLSSLLVELRNRIKEDLQDKVFYCVTDGAVIQRFFRPADPATDPPQLSSWGLLVQRRPRELFDPLIVGRFPESGRDIEDASLCFIFGQYTACVFHLMRVVEFGLRRLAGLGPIPDPKPSWGAVLQKLEKYAFRTEYKDLPPSLQPHIEVVKNLIPRMHAIQHTWRNMVMHVEEKLVPTEPFSAKAALEVMNATEAFRRFLASTLP